tara:strand:+ start:37 stop:894 length:858 start_codon:yes stop_codon:yes gene_type:complete
MTSSSVLNQLFRQPIYFIMGIVLFFASLIFNDAKVISYVLTVFLLAGGLPHGALDFFILKKIFSRYYFYISLVVYLAMSFIVFFVFNFTPTMFFIIFLIYSAFHFGHSDWEEHTKLSKYCWGFAVITLPSMIDPNESFLFFSIFIDDAFSALLVEYFSIFSILFALGTLLKKKDRILKLLILSVYLFLCYFSNIYFAFIAYFVGLHSIHHLEYWKEKVEKNTFDHLFVITLTVIVFFLVQLIFQVIPVGIDYSNLEEIMVYNAFLVIGSLTVPHMILIGYAKKSN